MTPNELDGLARAFRLEEQRPGGFLVNVQRDGETPGVEGQQRSSE